MYQASVRSATAGTTKTFLALVAILSLLLSFFAVAPASVAADEGTPVPLENGQGASAYDEGFNQECTEDEAVPEGSALFHFILNGLDDGTTLLSFEAAFDLNGDGTADVTYDLGDSNVTATQNASGNYSINVITDDDAVLVDATAVVTTQDGVNPEPKLVLSHTCVQEVTTGSLLILKTDTEGAPLAGATFDVTDGQGAVVADDVVSDENGIVCVDDLVPGSYTVTEVSAPDGYDAVEGSATVSVTAGDDCATRIGTDGTITAEEADVVLTNELILGSLLVLKTDGEGAPLAGATFDVTNGEGAVVADDVTSNDAGIICVDGLVPGTYTVEEVAPPAGYDPDADNPKTFDVVGSDDCATRIAAEDAPDLTFVNQEILGSITVNKEVACDVCETYTPGYYFNEGGNSAGVAFANESLASEPIEVGGLTFSSVADVQASAEPGSLLRHYLALVLNVRLAEENGCDLLSNVYDGSVEALQGMTVGDILAEAETVLNGGDSIYSEEQLHDAIDEINNNHGATDGVLACDGTSTGVGYSFSLLDDEGAEVDSGTTDDTGTLTFSDLPLGTYTLVETGNGTDEQCTIVSVSEGGTLNEDGSITVTITEETRDVVLTVVNECEGGNGGEESGHITVVKETDEAEPAESFAFGASWDSEGFSLMSGDSEPSGDLAVGDYTVTEELTADQIDAGWSLADIDCGDADVTVDLATSTVTVHLANGDDVTCTFSNEQEEQGGGTGNLEIDKFNCIGEADDTLFYVFGPFSIQSEPNTEDCTIGADVTFSVYTDAGEGVPGEYIDSYTTDEDGIIEVTLDPGDYVLVEGAEGEDGPSQAFSIEEGSTTAIVVLNVTAEEEQTGEVKILKFACTGEEDAVVFYMEGDETIPNLTECEVADATFTIDDGEEFTTENGGTQQTVTADVEHTLTEVDPLSGSTTFSVGADDLLTVIVINYQGEQEEQTGSITVNKEIECDICDTYTPGYYFNEGENNAGTAFAEESLSSDPITVGGFTFDSVQSVQDNAEPGSLLRHYLALVLNVRMADGTDCDLSTAVYSGSIEALDGLTVGEILDEAEAVLDGGDSSYSAEQLHDAIDEINNASETENGALSCDSTTGTAGFEFTLTDEADMSWTGTTGEDGSYTFEDLPLGVYTLEETGGPEGSDCTVVDATGTGVEFDAETGIVTITLTEENADVSVTVVNACGGEGGGGGELGSITVAKATSDETDAAFGFDFNGTSFELASGEWETFGSLEAGTYTAAEMVGELSADWSLDSIECVTLDGEEEIGDANAVIDLGAGTADVTLAEGEDVLCVFLNAMEQEQGGELGSITIAKIATGANGSSTSFGFTSDVSGSESFSLNGGASATMADLADGTYTVTEGTTTGWRLATLACTAGGSVDLASRTATVTIADGANVTCVFTNVVSEGTQGGGGTSPNQGGETPREGTQGGTLPNTAMDAGTPVSLPAAVLAILLLGGLAGAGHLAVAEARRRR